MDCDHNDSNDDEVVYGEIENWGSSMDGTTDEVFVTGHDNFWDDPIFQEDNSWMDFGNDDEEIAEPQENTSEDSDNVDTDTDSGRHEDDSPESIGSYHLDNNATTTEIEPPLLPKEYHQPLANEVLFKDNLPAKTLEMTCQMTCVPTAVATIIELMESDKSAMDVRARLEADYIMFKGEDYELCKEGIKKDDLDNFMTRAGFYSTTVEQLVNEINEGTPCTAVIDTDMGLHMVEIVGYFTESENENTYYAINNDNSIDKESIHAYQCINPGTGMYETHYDYEFNKYPNMIYYYNKYIR